MKDAERGMAWQFEQDEAESGARASTDGGIISPSAFAVFRLMNSSNFVGCSTAKSAGYAPLTIVSTKVAAR